MDADSYDLIVIGGGLIGLSTAYNASKRKLHTLVIERYSYFNNSGSSAGATRQYRVQYSQQYLTELALAAESYWNQFQLHSYETLIRLVARVGPYAAQAAFAIVVTTEESEFAVSDGSRAIQSMILAAWAEGVGSNWVGFRSMDEVKVLLDIPSAMDVLAIVPFGYPAQAVGRGKKRRKSLAEVAHSERFGQSFVK